MFEQSKNDFHQFYAKIKTSSTEARSPSNHMGTVTCHAASAAVRPSNEFHSKNTLVFIQNYVSISIWKLAIEFNPLEHEPPLKLSTLEGKDQRLERRL